MFGTMWPSSIVLADQLLDYLDELRESNVVELGCGLAVPSLVLAANRVQVVASDMHPLAATFLARNCENNQVPGIPFVQCLWPATIPDPTRNKVAASFDWIVGSDLLYESGQPEYLLAQIELCAHDETRVMITDPGRGQLAKFERSMTNLGFTSAAGSDNNVRWRLFSR